jgi:hypothetical protein
VKNKRITRISGHDLHPSLGKAAGTPDHPGQLGIVQPDLWHGQRILAVSQEARQSDPLQ